MRRRVLLAVALAALLAMGAPAQAFNVSSSAALASDAGLEVGSEHTTDTDFSNAQTLENVTVDGSGESASVKLETGQLIEGFEDGDIAEYGGNTTEYTVDTAPTHEGSYALNGTGGGGSYMISDTGQATGQGQTYSARLRAAQTAGSNSLIIGAQQEDSTPGGYLIQLSQQNDELVIFHMPTDGGFNRLATASVPLGANEWYKVTVEWQTDGTITATATDSAGTQLNSTSATNTSYQSGGIGFRYDDGVAGDSYHFDAVRGPATQGRYIGQNHSVDNAQQTWANLSLQNATATVESQAWTGSGWTVVNSSTFSATGNYTLDVSGTSYAKWRSNVTFKNESGMTTAELHDEGVLFQNDAPTVNNTEATPNETNTHNSTVTLSVPVNDTQFGTGQGEELTVEITHNGSVVDTQTVTSNGTVETTLQNVGDGEHTWHVDVTDSYGESTASDTYSYNLSHYDPVLNNSSAEPQGNTTTSAETVTLSINMTDSDFAYEGDELTVDYTLNGNAAGTDTLTANGTSSLDVSDLPGGTNTWNVTVTDEHGNTVTSASFDFQAPDTLYLRQEQQPGTLVTTQTNTTIKFFGDGEVYIRNTTNGKVDMTGLPTGQEFLVTADAPGYYNRRILIDSLVEQSNLFLLNESDSTVRNSSFSLNDRTGRYPDDTTTLEVQAALDLDGDGVHTWHTISGDYLGAAGQFPTTLQYRERYRIRISSNQGGTRILGTYIPTDNEDKVFDIGVMKFNVEQSESQYYFEHNIKSGPTGMEVKYSDPNNNTDSITVTAFERGNQSNELFSVTADDVGTEFYYQQNLTEAERNTDWVIDWEATRNGDETVGNQVRAGGHSVIMPMDVDPWLGTFSLIFITLGGVRLSDRYGSVGAVSMNAFAGVFMLFQWVNIHVAAWMVATLIALWAYVRDTGRYR